MNLDLRAPIIYEKTDEAPIISGVNDEFLQCYIINPDQGRSIEPDPPRFLDNLSFTGVKTLSVHDIPPSLQVILPAGHYLFTQERNEAVLSMDKWLELAIEQQKDGLWERQKPENLLYIRFLYEDGGYVTQVFRPVKK